MVNAKELTIIKTLAKKNDSEKPCTTYTLSIDGEDECLCSDLETVVEEIGNLAHEYGPILVTYDSKKIRMHKDKDQFELDVKNAFSDPRAEVLCENGDIDVIINCDVLINKTETFSKLETLYGVSEIDKIYEDSDDYICIEYYEN